MNIKKRRLIPVAIALVALIAVSGVAYAYWTATGSGTGTGTTAASASNVTVNQTTSLAPMYPGDSVQTLSGNFDNSNAGPIYITSVTASIGTVTKGGVVATGCDATDFTLDPTHATASVGVEIPHGTGVGSWTGPTIKFNDKGSNQDACKGVTVNLVYSIP